MHLPKSFEDWTVETNFIREVVLLAGHFSWLCVLMKFMTPASEELALWQHEEEICMNALLHFWIFIS